MASAVQMVQRQPDSADHIRDLRIDDLAQVVRIDADHTGVPKPAYWAGVFESFVGTDEQRTRVGLAAEYGGRLSGYLLGEIRAFEFGSEPCGWVFAVGVDPGHLRSNVATELLRNACERFRGLGVRKIRTMVERTDVPVMSFFRSNGFVGGAFYQLEMDLEDKMSETAVKLESLAGGGLWLARLATPKANILDQEKFEALSAIFERAASDPDLKAILLAAEGPHFSFGASVEEHLPGSFETMIRTFHSVIRAALATHVTCLAAVNGQCLGGALELITVCSRIFVSPDSMFGQPEIRLGVFPPVASVLLPDRIGQARAEEICLSGRSLGADEACRIGLVDEITDDPEATALEYFETYLAPHSARSLRLAAEAVRTGQSRRFDAELEAVEKLYLERLMATEDAVEGLESFLAKRPPEWRNR